MRRLAPILLLAVLATPPAARAADRPLRVRVVTCHTGPREAARYLSTTARVRLVAGSRRVVLRYELFWRPVGAPHFARYPSSPFERTFRGPAEHDYSVSPLAPLGADYRVHVRARWFAMDGGVVRTARRVTRICHQPDFRPDLTVVGFVGRRDGRFAAVVENVGATGAGPFRVGGAEVPGLRPGRSVRVVVGACEQVLLDADGRVDERNESNNSARAPCPVT